MIPIKNKSHLLLCFILLIALVLRIQKINQPYVDAYSFRQCSTAMMAENFYKQNWNILYPQVNWSGPGPSYQGREFQTVTYISALLYTVFGQQDWIGRAVSLLFGLWGIFALYQLVRRIWDEQHALAAAALMAILPFAVFMERSFLPGPAMVALVITSIWMLVVFLQTDRKLYLYLSAILGCLGFLTKITGMLLCVPMLFAVVSLLYNKGQLQYKKIIPIIVTGIIMIIPVTSYYLWARHLSLTYPPYHFAGSGNWLWDLGLNYMIKKKFFLKIFILEFIPSLWSIPAFALALFGLFIVPPQSRYKFQKGESRFLNPIWVFHTYFLGCLFFYFIGAEELRWNPWNFHIFSPVIAILGARGLVFIANYKVIKQQTFLTRGFAVLLLIMVNGFFIFKKLSSPDNHLVNYKMGLALKQVRKPGELVVTVARDIANPMVIYYSGSKGWVFPPTINNFVPLEIWPSKQSISALNGLVQKGAKWFAIANERFADIEKNQSDFANYLKTNHELFKQTPEYSIFVLKKTSGESLTSK